MVSELEPGLHWGVRDSFFQYLAGLPDGRVSVSDGATLGRTDPQVVHYPVDNAATTDAVLAFRGDLRMGGHGGLLFVRLAQPRLALAGPGERIPLTVADPLTEDGSGPRLSLVTLVLASDDHGWLGTEVRLTDAGAALFNHVYAGGAAFEDLLVR